MFTAPRQQNNETKKHNKTAATSEGRREMVYVWERCEGFILNEAQWLNFPSLGAWKTDTSSPLDFSSLCCCR